MSTDLKTARDHPANLIHEAADTDRDSASSVRNGMHVAAETLTTYERQHQVTFAALDNDALQVVREEYEGVQSASGDEQYVGAMSLANAVRDLLGLED